MHRAVVLVAILVAICLLPAHVLAESDGPLPPTLFTEHDVVGTSAPTEPRRPVKVFILAGQSNMEGKAKVAVAKYQAQQPTTRELYKDFWKNDAWVARDDVWIKYLKEAGRLKVGYGSPACIGPELGFGSVVGDRYAEPVLLIKTAWGGKSLYRDFRSPSAGLPREAVLEKMLVERRKRQPQATAAVVQAEFGASYRAMLAEVHGTLGDLKTYLPGYEGQGYELAGIIWFQGWNDMIDSTATAEYTTNLAHFIRDVRKDLKAPKLPFVVGQMGVGGPNPDANVRRFQEAQAAILNVPAFQGNVALVKTARFWDADADALFKKGWRENPEAWNRVGSDYPYHYLGSPRTMLHIGRAFAESVLALRGEGLKNP